MPNPVQTKPETLEKPETVESKRPIAPLTGKRFIIWNPRLDPTVEAAPQRSTPIRPFVMSYVQSDLFALTPVAPGGSVVPQFKSITLLPGLNEISCADWASAVAAGEQYGKERSQVLASHSTSERLALSSQHGLDPIQEQIEAQAIVVPALTTETPTGTIGDYSAQGVVKIVATVTDALTIQSWLTGIAQGSIVHSEKAKIERILKDAIDKINGQG